MPLRGRGRDEPQTRLEAQIKLILPGTARVAGGGLEGAAAHPGNWAERGDVDYLHRERTILVRDVDVERVMAVVPCQPVAHDNNLRGLTRLAFSAKENRLVEE